MVSDQRRAVIFVGPGTMTGSQIFRFTDTGESFEDSNSTCGPSMNVPVAEDRVEKSQTRLSWKEKHRRLKNFLR